LTIVFRPDSDNNKIILSTKAYQDIWDKEGEKIIEAMERQSGLKFKKRLINAIVFDGMSCSHPLSLRYNYSDEVKKATLIHELCHRLFVDNKVEIKTNNPKFTSLEIHKRLYLILYPVWVELYGEKFAKRNIEVECERGDHYKKAWDWFLSLKKSDKKTKR